MSNGPFRRTGPTFEDRWELVQGYIEKYGLKMAGSISRVGVIVTIDGVAGHGLTLLDATENAVRRVILPEIEA
jgi:hypothetical protein